MAIIKYAQYVVINEEKGVVVWNETHTQAVASQKANGGVIYNTDTCNTEILENALHVARQRMGVE